MQFINSQFTNSPIHKFSISPIHHFLIHKFFIFWLTRQKEWPQYQRIASRVPTELHGGCMWAPVFKGNMFQEERLMPMKKKAKKKKH